MQSSTAIAIRALIMLIVLISVPLFAIFGKNLPEVLKGLLEGRGLVLAPAANQESPAPLAGGNSLGQPTAYRAGPSAGNVATAGAANSAVNPTAANSVAAANVADAARTATLPAGTANSPRNDFPRGEISRSDIPHSDAGRNGLPRSGADDGSFSSPAAWQGGNSLTAPPGLMNPSGGPMTANDGRTSQFQSAGVQPTGFQAPIDAKSSASPVASQFNSDLAQTTPYSSTLPQKNAGPPAAAQTVAGSASGDERMRQAETRLRQLGASYYMLETYGAENNRYRFLCKMPTGGLAKGDQVFLAIEDDPWMAMNSVVRQIERWRGQPAQ